MMKIIIWILIISIGIVRFNYFKLDLKMIQSKKEFGIKKIVVTLRSIFELKTK